MESVSLHFAMGLIVKSFLKRDWPKTPAIVHDHLAFEFHLLGEASSA
jgi:hypothetical protein